MPAEIGKASRTAVRADSCLGDRFLVEGMYQIITKIPRPGSEIELIAYSFDRGDTIQPQLLADLADMHVDGPVPHDHFIAPDLVEDLVSQKDPSRPGRQQIEQLEFLFGQSN